MNRSSEIVKSNIQNLKLLPVVHISEENFTSFIYGVNKKFFYLFTRLFINCFKTCKVLLTAEALLT